jgi:hypothetical protein
MFNSFIFILIEMQMTEERISMKMLHKTKKGGKRTKSKT